jgi:hypothetical protein
MFMRFSALVLRMGVIGLRRQYFKDPFSPMTQSVFQNLLYTIRDVGFPAYPEGDPLRDGRTACTNDPFRQVRRFGDGLQHTWQELVVPGSVIVAEETMVGWTGATNIHITYLPNKPTSRGVCMKTLCDARTRVMIGFEFVEARAEQQQKRYAAEGLSAAVTLRLTEPWHNTAPRLLIADAWFSGMPTSFALMSRGIFSITNVKTHTKYFCKKELWADSKGAKMGHERNDRSYQQLCLRVNGKDTTFTGAFHMDKAPMTLLGTAGSSREAPPVMRRRMYMTDDGDMVRWVGELQQPDIRYIYRSNFNAVDVHNKLAVGPRSVCNVATNSLPLKLWLSLVACAETNAYLMYVHLNKLTSEQYNCYKPSTYNT